MDTLLALLKSRKGVVVHDLHPYRETRWVVRRYDGSHLHSTGRYTLKDAQRLFGAHRLVARLA